MELFFWGNSSCAQKVFLLQKKAMRIIFGMKNRESCRPLFKNLNILTLAKEYICSLMCYVVDILEIFETNFSVHSLNTRNRNNLYIPVNSLKLSQKGSYFSAIQIYNRLPNHIKVLGNQRKCKFLKNSLKEFLGAHTFYSLDEYYEFNST